MQQMQQHRPCQYLRRHPVRESTLYWGSVTLLEDREAGRGGCFSQPQTLQMNLRWGFALAFLMSHADLLSVQRLL